MGLKGASFCRVVNYSRPPLAKKPLCLALCGQLKGKHIMATANPAMNEAVYRRAGRADSSTSVMSLQGTVLKTGILVLILLFTSGYTWSQTVAGSTSVSYGLLIAGSIGGFIMALVTIFLPRYSPVTAPIYAALE